VAALIKHAIGIEPEQVVGNRGEFTVWLDGVLVGRKESADDELVRAMSNALEKNR
jgi:hypothetical protein